MISQVCFAYCDTNTENATGLLIHNQFDTQLPAIAISSYLSKLATKELGTDHLRKILKAFENTVDDDEKNEEDEFLLEELSSKILSKISSIKSHVNHLGTLISQKGLVSDQVALLSCCSNSQEYFLKGCTISSEEDDGRDLSLKATSVFEEIGLQEGLTRQYLISSKAHVEYPLAQVCGAQVWWHQSVFNEAIHPDAKNVLVILDRGSSRNLQLGRAIAYYLIESLSQKDYVNLITLDHGNATLALSSKCGSKMLKATSLVKSSLHSHLNKFNQFSSPNLDPIEGLQLAKNVLVNVPKNTSIDLFLVTSANSIRSPKHFEHFYQKFEKLFEDNKIFLHLYFMDSISREHEEIPYTIKYFTEDKSISFNTKIIGDMSRLAFNIADSFDHHAGSEGNFVILSPNVEDKNSKVKTVVPLAKPIHLENGMNAVIGVDIDYNYLFEDLVYHSDYNTYTCILDRDTRTVIFHPKIFSADNLENEMTTFPQGIPFHVLEEEDTLEELENRIYSTSKGSFQLGASSSINEITSMLNGGLRTKLKKYQWKHLTDEFVIVVVDTKSLLTQRESSTNDISTSEELTKPFTSSFVFHRLDLLADDSRAKLCRHFDFPATLEKGSVFLSPNVFKKPFDYLKNNMTKVQMTELMTYLSSENTTTTDQISDVIDVYEYVKDEVNLLSQIGDYWKNMSFSSGMNNYIVRRYATTSNGVYFNFPGSPIIKEMNPTAQDWYLSATKFSNRVIINRPRLDLGGAGYVLTLSRQVGKDKAKSKAVVAMDMSMSYIYNMIFDANPICQNMVSQGVRCFLFDHHGYLIVHGSQFEANLNVKVVDQHLTHVEHLAMNLMLEDSTLVRKTRCKDYSSMTVQNFYQFNTNTLIENWNNHNQESCLKYSVSSLPGTNVFFGIVQSNGSCSARESTLFCPCSVSGRQCILCEEESVNSCECPCECPLQQCSSGNAENDADLPMCDPAPQKIRVVPQASTKYQSQMMTQVSLPQCFESTCEQTSRKEKCFGVIGAYFKCYSTCFTFGLIAISFFSEGCDWCQYEIDMDNPGGTPKRLKQAFCSESSKCFGGILGTPSPYDRMNHGSRLIEDEKYFFRPTPSIGPIAGSIVSAFLFLAISGYCIRNYNKCLCRGDYNSCSRNRRNGSNLRMSHFEEILEDNDSVDELNELGVTHKNLVLTNQENAIVVSPYRMNPMYRRQTDSDQGYSTMTPIGDLDSEIIPYVDSASARHRLQRMQQRNQNGPSAQSVTSGVSSRTSSPTPLTPASKSQNTNSSSALTHQSNSLSSNEEVVRGTTCNASKAVSYSKTNNDQKKIVLPVRSFSESSEENSQHQQFLDPETMLPKANRNQFIHVATVHMVDT